MQVEKSASLPSPPPNCATPPASRAPQTPQPKSTQKSASSQASTESTQRNSAPTPRACPDSHPQWHRYRAPCQPQRLPLPQPLHSPRYAAPAPIPQSTETFSPDPSPSISKSCARSPPVLMGPLHAVRSAIPAAVSSPPQSANPPQTRARP